MKYKVCSWIVLYLELFRENWFYDNKCLDSIGRNHIYICNVITNMVHKYNWRTNKVLNNGDIFVNNIYWDAKVITYCFYV